MTKGLRKESMIRSKLRKKYNKFCTSVNLQNYRKQRDKYTKVLRNGEQQYFINLNSKSITDTKSKTANAIILHENNRIIKDDKKIPHTLNKYFTNLTKTLILKNTSPALKNNLKHLIRHFKNHSTTKIKKHFNSKEFTFHEFKETGIIKTMESPKNKASTFKDIPVIIMINPVHIYSQVLTNIFNDCVKNGSFTDIFKHADITPVFKKGNSTDKTNYRPISTLSNFPNVFEKLIYVQINSFMKPKLFK